jgi:hypothetical protein
MNRPSPDEGPGKSSEVKNKLYESCKRLEVGEHGLMDSKKKFCINQLILEGLGKNSEVKNKLSESWK